MKLDPKTDLVLEREIDAPRHILFKCWTVPEHIMQWFVPKPHKVASCEIDLRVGGVSRMVFDVGGNMMDNNGVYLEVIPNEKLVFTDSYGEDWKPNPEPFMTGIIAFDDLGNGRTKYTAIVRHRSAEDAERHRSMGFHDGWGIATDQLAEYAGGLK